MTKAPEPSTVSTGAVHSVSATPPRWLNYVLQQFRDHPTTFLGL